MDALRLEDDAHFPGYFWCQISQDPQTGWFLLAQVETRLGLARGFRVEKCGKAAEAKRDLFFEQTLEDETRGTR